MNDNNFSDKLKAKKTIKITTLVGIIFVLLIAVISAFNIYSEFLEIREIGQNFVSVFFKNMIVKGLFQACSFIGIFIIVYISILFLQKNLKRCGVTHDILKRNFLIVILSLVASYLASGFVSNSIYEKFLLFVDQTPFNINDPLFFMDIGYFIFQRPFLILITENVLTIWVMLTIAIAVIYFLLYIKIGERTVVDFIKNHSIVTHLIVNISVYLIIKALSMWIMAQGVVLSEFSELKGGGFVDVNVWLNYYKVAPYILIAITTLTIILLLKGQIKKAIISCASFVGIIIIINVIAWGVQVFHVSPNEVAVEAPYIQHNIDYTRKAYNIDNITETEYAINDNISTQQIKDSQETIDNIRIIDFPATLTATNQLQGLRNYYTFNDLDVGVYNINGKEQAVAIGVREIAKDNLEESAKNYINQKFRFTHGFGLVMTSFSTVNSQGQPDYFIKDILPEEKSGVPSVTQPRIYFGELTNDQVIVKTKTRELDYSEGTKDEEFDYDGNAGIKLNFANKLIFAFKTGDFRMIIANQITKESRLLLNRNIIERAKKIAPFIKYDSDAHIVIDDDGKLKWVIDGYTYSNQYPYSQITEGFNYIRNSVKIVIDAYDGTLKFYIIDKTDPIIQTYQKIYPTLFENDTIPESIMSKSKYPEWLFSKQCKMYAQYHNTSPTTFYNKNDMYTVANEKYAQEIKPIEPYYNIMKLNEFNKDKAEMVLMLPFNLVNRENMVSWIAAGNKGDNYGKLVAYKFPKNINIYGPLQVENLIDNNPDISKEMTLWNSGGSNVIRGNLLVIPMSGTLLYIEPVYLTSNNQASLPSLKRIIAVYNNKVAMESDLSTALSKVLDKNVKIEQTSADEIPKAEKQIDDKIIANVVDSYNKLEEHAKVGDWEAFGIALKEMQSAVAELEKNYK